MGIPILAQARLALLAGGLSVAGAAWAVGDSPRQLDRRQAVAAYAGIRPLLTNDGVTCPAGQTPVFGAITGGAGPAGGSRTTTVQFDKGGVVRVVRTWSRTPGGRPASSFEVTCSDHVDLSQRAPDDPPVSQAERCRQVEQSLRVPPSDRCDSDATRADAAAPPATAGRTASQTVVDQDIARFWQAFDAISATTDPAERLRLIQTIYIDPGTPGLHALMAARRYTAQQYVDAIVNWPRFWRSIRPLTARSGQAVLSLNDDVARFRRLYPELRPASITYAIGVLRTGGTTTGNKVLIGAELALGDETVDVSELPAPRQSRLGVFFASRPFANNAQNNIHEYVHTQQQETQGSLAQQVLREGVAELVAELVTGRKPALPVYTYGPTHDSAIRQRFTAEMRGDDYDNWLWNSASNPFGVSDVGYYVGYRIARSYYDAARDKRRAVRELIELHYDDPGAVHALIDRSGYFGSR